ncbi:MAG: hypothetical protein WA077_04985, partial [Anaerolineae bacterium]
MLRRSSIFSFLSTAFSFLSSTFSPLSSRHSARGRLAPLLPAFAKADEVTIGADTPTVSLAAGRVRLDFSLPPKSRVTVRYQ